ISWDPGQADKAWDQATIAPSGIHLARRVASPDHRIIVALPLLDQVVVEETDRGQALLNGGIGQPDAGVERDDIGTTRAGPLPKMPNIAGNLRSPCREWIDPFGLANMEIVGEGAPVGIDGARRQAQVLWDLKPVLCCGKGIEGLR